MPRSLGLLLLSCLACTLACGQSTFATLQGTVRDASGGVVPGARVTVRNVGQNVAFTSATNELGNYETHNLSPGEYEVVVEAQGFKKFVHGGIELNAKQVVRIDARLEVGASHEEVTVSEGSPVVSSETATIDDARTNREILSLPNAGRFGNSAPFILAGPGMAVWSGGLQKRFSLGEQRRLRLMATFQNLANHPNFGLPANNISAPGSVGRITGTLGTEGAGARTVELSARFEF